MPCWFWHSWKEVKDTGFHKYLVCKKCQKRKIKEIGLGGYQPIDRTWLETGEWSVMKPPQSGSPPKLVKYSKFDEHGNYIDFYAEPSEGMLKCDALIEKYEKEGIGDTTLESLIEQLLKENWNTIEMTFVVKIIFKLPLSDAHCLVADRKYQYEKSKSKAF